MLSTALRRSSLANGRGCPRDKTKGLLLLDLTERRELREGYWLGARWTIVLLVSVLVLSAVAAILIWGFKVGTSDIKGRGDAVRQHNSATNRIFAQQHFEDLHQGVQRDVANVSAARAAVKVDPSQVNKTNVVGAIQVCNADVADYNASARKYLERDFRAADLPPSIDNAVCNGD